MSDPVRRSSGLIVAPFALLALTLTMLGCLPAAGAVLDGREFLSTAVTEGGAERPLVVGTRIRLTFTPGSLGASAGCNHIGGSYRLDGGRIVFTGASMTEMGCDAQRHAQDDWLVSFLSANPSAQLAGDTLVLTAGDTAIRLLDRRVADPDRPLVGPTWVVVGLIAGSGDSGAVSSVPDGIVASLRFHEDGTVAIQTGCNQGGGRWALEGSRLRFSELVLTEIACPDAAGQVEAAVIAVLGADAVDASIEAAQLILQAGGQGLQLEAR